MSLEINLYMPMKAKIYAIHHYKSFLLYSLFIIIVVVFNCYDGDNDQNT